MAQRRQQQPAVRTRFVTDDGQQLAGAEDAPAGRRRRAERRAGEGGEERASWYRPTASKIAFIAVVLVAVVFGAQLCSSATPINVTVNGTQYALRGEKNLAVALKESGLPINPGDFISLQGNVLQRSQGDPFSATVNGEETADPAYKLRDGDVVTLADGKDVVEPYDAVQSPIPYGASIVGSGAIHTFAPGSDGVLETRTGKVSGEVVDKQTVDPVDVIESRFDPDVGDRKVVALTFDDGPSSAYTEDILDILQANGAKATFFCRGDAIDAGGADIVRRAAAEGHQICTHSYDNADLLNGETSLLTAEELQKEVMQGLQAIEDALATEDAPYVASKVVRVGPKDLEESSIAAVAPLIDAEIGWTLDTGDWVYMSENDIYGVLMSAKPGSVIRMHDGGDHQDVTAAALKRALPKLAKKGYSFVTVDQLMGWGDSSSEDGSADEDVLE